MNHVFPDPFSYLLFTGRGTGVVVATGEKTEFGVIFSMMQDVRLDLF